MNRYSLVSQIKIANFAQDIAKHYVFVGSAGAYDANKIEPLHVEGDKRKSSAGHVKVEEYLSSSTVPYTVFQPQYIYGPYTAKVPSQCNQENIRPKSCIWIHVHKLVLQDFFKPVFVSLA